MKAIRVEDDVDNSLIWTEVPEPSFDDREVLVDVRATAVNRADLLQRRGLYPPPDGASEILGLEVSGTVAAVGSEVDSREIGDTVCALLPGGGYAERVAVPAEMLLDVPDRVDTTEAAGIPEVFYTAYVNLRLEAEHEDGESVLVHAGASGVGTAALQLCNLFDATVYSTASTSKLEVLRRFDVDVAIDRTSEDFEEIIEEHTGGRGVDVVLDLVSGDYIPRDVRSLAPRGRLVVIGLLRGTEAELPLGDLLRGRKRVIGSVLRSRSLEEKVEITERFRAEVWPHFEEGALSPVVYERFPIQRAEEAHELVRSNETAGKVLLEVGADDPSD